MLIPIIAVYLVGAVCMGLCHIYWVGLGDGFHEGLDEDSVAAAVIWGSLWPAVAVIVIFYVTLSPLAKAVYAAGVRANERKRDASHPRN